MSIIYPKIDCAYHYNQYREIFFKKVGECQFRIYFNLQIYAVKHFLTFGKNISFNQNRIMTTSYCLIVYNIPISNTFY
jgi:hypothetical protein